LPGFSLVVLLSGFVVPVGLSALRLLPIPLRLTVKMEGIFNHAPIFGRRHRVTYTAGLTPTRGQSLFIGYLILLNVALWTVDYHTVQPHAWYGSDNWQMHIYRANRAGMLAFANLALMFLYSTRNNLLLWLTDWSHQTFLMLHRWVGYIAIVQASIHASMWLHFYLNDRLYIPESRKEYWYWGIITILSMCLAYPLSLLPIRRAMYEVFLLTHNAMAIIVLVGAYLHIWFQHEHAWGYEIWIYTAGGIWGLDRTVRLVRFAANGVRQAVISKIDEDYVRVDVEGIVAHGYVYIYFPTLSWRFWENHPFSVMSSFASVPQNRVLLVENAENTAESVEKNEGKEMTISKEVSVGTGLSSRSIDAIASTNTVTGPTRPRLSVVMRVQSGMTSRLAARTQSSPSSFKLPVLIESSYGHQPRVMAALGRCSTLLCIAGGVGIGTVLPLVHRYCGVRIRLCWGVRNDSLLRALEPELSGISPFVQIEHAIGKRLDMRAILEQELLQIPGGGLESGIDSNPGNTGDVGIVFSGPEGMADEVRALICELSLRRGCKGYVFVDEAFSW
jgi:hypothetical protein